ncbi:unnamed protein product [Phytophthora lilii]|uniref:Unnamed protein product n=1 Tax=Phytophthora lilii TaxID=2077276 RepID=A0A9W6T7W3_9STRA|nr:unnamed protein product [Phytophthora lilii]
MFVKSEWVEKFLSEIGVEELLAPLQVPGGATVETCNEVLTTLFALTNCSRGVAASVQLSKCCSQLFSLFDSSPSSEIKVRSLTLLGLLCRESTMTQEAIMNAFAPDSPEERSLQSLVTKLEQNQSDISLQLAGMKFINTLMGNTRDRKQRASICEDLKTSGFLALLDPFKNRDDIEPASGIVATMIAEVKEFSDNYCEATKDDRLGALRLALGDALNRSRSNEVTSEKGECAGGNQRESDGVDQPALKDITTMENAGASHSVPAGFDQSTANSVGSLKEVVGAVDGISIESKKNDASSVIAESTVSLSEGLSLDAVFGQLQLHTRKLDQETNEKLTSLLKNIALTISDESGASEAVDRLHKSFLTTQNQCEEKLGSSAHSKESKSAVVPEAKHQEPDLLTRVGMALFPSMGDTASSITKPPVSSRPALFSGFGDFSLPSLTATTPAKSSVSRTSFSSFIGADGAASPWGRSIESSGARGVKLSLPFFQGSRKGPSLGVTPACTPIATASVRKDAKRPVFPSFPSPPRQEVPAVVSPVSQNVTTVLPTATAIVPPSAPSLPPIDIAPTISPLEEVSSKPTLVIEPDIINTSNTVQPPATGTDISKFRKLLSMGAPREAVRAKMQQAGVDPDLLDEQQGFTPKASPRPASSLEKTTSNTSKNVVESPGVLKFRKLLSMGAPMEAAKAKMRQAGLDPDLLDRKENDSTHAPPPSTGPDISKFRKLFSMGAPLAAVKAKMAQAGLDPALLDGPISVIPGPCSPSATLKVKDDVSYAKFFKLLSMGAPVAAVKAKMVQAGLNSDLLDTPDAEMPTNNTPLNSTTSPAEVLTNPQALLSNMIASRAAPQPETQTKVKDDPQYAKFFKLLSMGAPAESVKAKMRMAGLQPELLDTPDAPLKSLPSAPDVSGTQPKVKIKDDPAYAKFFKLLSMGAPAESVKAKMRMAGLNPDFLNTPEAAMPNPNLPAVEAKVVVKVKDDPAYAKFFKLLSMGAPAESVKVKMQMAGLKPELLDTPDAELSSGVTNLPSQPQLKVREDPAYAKFFKLLEMGAPPESVKAKMRMAGLQGDLLDTPDAVMPSTAPSNQPAVTSSTTTAARRAHLSIAIKPVVKAKTRSFYWQHLKGEAIKGTIWEELEKENSNQSNQDLLTLTESELEILETEFPPPAACGPNTGTRRGSMSGIGSPGGPASPLASPRIVFLIDRARSNNISIIVKQFRTSNAALRVAIMKMDSEVLTLDRVQGLIKILPTEEEIAAITGFSGDPTTLNGAELVLKELITVPRLKQRLSALETKHQFPALVRDLHTKINKIRVASNEISQSSELKTLLMVILQVGNKMNHGTARGGAKGFRLNDLTKLVQLKSVDKSVTLLHYVARMVRMKKGNVVRLGDSLASLYDVQSIPIPELQGDMNRINDITESINVELAAQRLKNRIEEKEENDLFVESMTTFVDDASKEVATLKKDLDEILRLMRDIMSRFDKNTDEDDTPSPAADAPLTPAALTGASEFFSIIYEFTMSLMKADRENELKRIREEKRLKLKATTPRRNSVDRATLSKLNPAAGPKVLETPRRKSMVAVPSSISVQSEGASSLLPGTLKQPSGVSTTDAVTSAKETEMSTPAIIISAGSDAEKGVSSKMFPSEPQSSGNKDDGMEASEITKAAIKATTEIPKTALKVPSKIIKASALPSAASPLKKVIGVMPTGIPSPMKLKRTNSSASSTEKSSLPTVSAAPFDAASLSEIKAQLKSKHSTNNEPQVLRVSKPEVEAEAEDHDNNNSEPSSPEKALSEAEPSTRVAVQSDA